MPTTTLNRDQLLRKKLNNSTNNFFNRTFKTITTLGAFFALILGVLMLFPDVVIWMAQLLGYKPGVVIKVELRKLLPFFGYLILVIAFLQAIVAYLLHRHLVKAALVGGEGAE